MQGFFDIYCTNFFKVLQRKNMPPFHFLLEIMARNKIKIFQPLGLCVDDLLAKNCCIAEERWVDQDNFLRSRIIMHHTPKEDFELPQFG